MNQCDWLLMKRINQIGSSFFFLLRCLPQAAVLTVARLQTFVESFQDLTHQYLTRSDEHYITYIPLTVMTLHVVTRHYIAMYCKSCLDFYLFSLRGDSLHWGTWKQVYLCNYEGKVGKERRSRKRFHQARIEPMTSRWSGHSSNHCATNAAVLLDC